MELKRLCYPYPYIPASERAALLPQRSICSIAPAEDPADALYTGNGSHRIDVTGQPYRDSLTVNMELLQEPKWKETPRPPDLRPYLKDIRDPYVPDLEGYNTGVFKEQLINARIMQKMLVEFRAINQQS